MKYALLGFSIGVVLCLAIAVGWWLSIGSKLEGRYLDDLERARVELADAQGELESVSVDLGEARRRLASAILEAEEYRKALEGSRVELGKLREFLSRGQDAVDSSLVGVDRIRGIIQRLPRLE